MSSYRDAQPPGLEITPDLATWETLHKCPRCLLELFAGERAGFRIEACGRCGGVWIAGEQLQRALGTGSRAAEELSTKVAAVTQSVVIDDAPPLACPECAQNMTKSWLGRVALDSCEVHGTWFDRHELPQAMRAFRGEPAGKAASAERDLRQLQQMRPAFSKEIQGVAQTISSVIDALERALSAAVNVAGGPP
jgi:Zn-finger nucleic acid-binding protein